MEFYDADAGLFDHNPRLLALVKAVVKNTYDENEKLRSRQQLVDKEHLAEMNVTKESLKAQGDKRSVR